jgi:hypothetical protein
MFASAILLRLGLLPVFPIPNPRYHDEFSYLLGADTLASGRLANPPHALWQFFETFHVLSQPAYASKYQPGQALFLAAGQRLFGHPFYGVVFSVGLLVAGLVWMLQAWAPPGYALIGGCAALLSFGVGHYWSGSYWGGAVPALATALLLGSYGRITAQGRYGFAWLYGLALALLALTRPFEGGVLAALVSLGLLPGRPPWRAVGLPIAAVLSMFAIWEVFYNLRVTGDPLLLPYAAHVKQYDSGPYLWIQPLPPEKTYRYPELRAIYRDYELTSYRQLVSSGPGGAFWGCLQRTFLLLLPTMGLLPILAIALGALAWRNPGIRLFLAITVALTLVACLEVLGLLHYLASLWVACFGLAVLVAAEARKRAPAIAYLVLGLLLAWPALRLVLVFREHSNPPEPEKTYRQFGDARANLVSGLLARGRKHVVIVRYASDHNAHLEWVANKANIDASPVVWARDRGPIENQRLVEHYRGWSIWLLEPDVDTSRLTPYPINMQSP